MLVALCGPGEGRLLARLADTPFATQEGIVLTDAAGNTSQTYTIVVKLKDLPKRR